ncbi:RDD family protein [uncultured Corynebacterium sp.]|uniref:RDD family protein n=1 Tax=uncultured Corynebacterium sp. TaxID=159447 RepID=UPI0025D39D6C|nr:RDD family protein [uncultured Corynebacterium sp.]
MSTPSGTPENPFSDDHGQRDADQHSGAGPLPSYDAYTNSGTTGDGTDAYTGAPLTGAGTDQPYPGAGRRLGALVIDNIIISIIGFVLVTVIAGSDFTDYADKFQTWHDAGEPGDAPVLDLGNFVIALLLTLIIWFVYRLSMEVRRGQTLGKMALKIKVVDADGKLLTAGASFKRNSWYIAVFLLSMFVGFIGSIVVLILMAVLGVMITRSPFGQHTFDQWAKAYVVNTN